MNDKEKVEAIKVQILERRNYLRAMEAPIKYSKGNLYSGMQERVRRQEDRSFQRRATKQGKLLDKELLRVNKYLTNLGAYSSQQNGLSDNQMMQVQSTPLIAAPSPLQFVMPKMIKENVASRVRQRIGGKLY